MVLGIVVTLGLFVALLAAMEIGRWARRRMVDSESYDSTAADTVVFGLMPSRSTPRPRALTSAAT